MILSADGILPPQQLAVQYYLWHSDRKYFAQFLEGAAEVDRRATNKNLLENPEMLDALIGVYERNVLGYPATAVLPYSQALSRFPAHLQQMDMESNGKSVNRFGEPIDYVTGPLIFGEPGTNGQHSFYQLCIRETDIVPLQFIGFKDSQIGTDVVIQGKHQPAEAVRKRGCSDRCICLR